MADEGGLGLTYGDLLLCAARELGCEHTDEDGEPIIPPFDTARDDLRLCETIVMRAVRWLTAASPDWPWLRQQASVTFEEGESEYDMPWWFNGMVYGPWVFSSTGPTETIKVVTQSEYDQSRSGYSDDSTGDPCICTFRVKEPTDGVRQPSRWQVVFWPTPGTEYTITINARAYPTALRDPSDRFMGGEEVNQALEAAVLFEAASERRTDRMADRRSRRDECLAMALSLVNAAKPRDLGQLAQTMWLNGHEVEPLYRTTGVTYYQDTLVT